MRLLECQELSGAGILSYLHEFCIFRLDLILQKKKLRELNIQSLVKILDH